MPSSLTDQTGGTWHLSASVPWQDEGTLLRWLYPSAQLVVISRNPLDAYRSVKDSAKDWSLYARWPDRRVDCTVMLRTALGLAGVELEPIGATRLAAKVSLPPFSASRLAGV